MNPDSEADIPSYQEFIQSLDKEKEFNADVPFELLSTIRYDPKLSDTPPKNALEVTKSNFFLLPEHIERMKFTIDFFRQIDSTLFKENASRFIVTEDFVLRQLKETLEESQISVDKPLKVRLLVTKQGEGKIELYETPERQDLLDGLSEDFPDPKRYDVFVDTTPVLASPFTCFKTTHRDIYSSARERALPGNSSREEVVLINTTSQVMEGSITNIAIKSKEGVWITPKLTSGCLCGVTRHFLLKKNLIQEDDISVDMLKDGHDVMLMNGILGCVRGTIKGFVGRVSY